MDRIEKPTDGGVLVESIVDVVVCTMVEAVEEKIVKMGFGGEEERRWWLRCMELVLLKRE